MCKITIWRERRRERNYVGWKIKIGWKTIQWEDLTKKQQIEILENMKRVYDFLYQYREMEDKE